MALPGIFTPVELDGRFLIDGGSNLTGIDTSPEASPFASQLVDLYASTLGEWFRPIIAVIALMAMLTTTLTAIDASPRSLAVAQSLLQRNEPQDQNRLHALWMIG